MSTQTKDIPDKPDRPGSGDSNDLQAVEGAKVLYNKIPACEQNRLLHDGVKLALVTGLGLIFHIHFLVVFSVWITMFILIARIASYISFGSVLSVPYQIREAAAGATMDKMIPVDILVLKVCPWKYHFHHVAVLFALIALVYIGEPISCALLLCTAGLRNNIIRKALRDSQPEFNRVGMEALTGVDEAPKVNLNVVVAEYPCANETTRKKLDIEAGDKVRISAGGKSVVVELYKVPLSAVDETSGAILLPIPHIAALQIRPGQKVSVRKCL